MQKIDIISVKDLSVASTLEEFKAYLVDRASAVAGVSSSGIVLSQPYMGSLESESAA